jgi:osmotically inducible protein OsmC
MKRTASAFWQGTGKEGNGHLSTGSKTLHSTPYSFHSRFEEGAGTNPEELIAAAHSGCFTMKLAFNLSGAGFVPTTLETGCTITFEGGLVTHSHLQLKAVVPGITAEQFDDLVKDAELNCPISKLLNTEISVSYELA